MATRKYPKYYKYDSVLNEKAMKAIVKALKEDDRTRFLDAIGEFNGQAAVRYFIHAMLDYAREHKQTLPGALKLLEGTDRPCEPCDGSGVIWDTQVGSIMAIERCDVCNKYATDEEALDAVRETFEAATSK